MNPSEPEDVTQRKGKLHSETAPKTSDFLKKRQAKADKFVSQIHQDKSRQTATSFWRSHNPLMHLRKDPRKVLKEKCVDEIQQLTMNETARD